MNWEKFLLQLLELHRYSPTVVWCEEAYTCDMEYDEKWQYVKLNDLFRMVTKSIKI